MKQVFINTEENMKKCLNALSKEYIAIRAGRANPAVLDKILVDYYGAPTPINQLAAVSVTALGCFGFKGNRKSNSNFRIGYKSAK